MTTVKVISQVLEIDGKIVRVDVSGNSTDGPSVNPDDYDETGFSLETQFGCATRNKEVDEYRLALAQGDKFEQEAAAQLPEWFAVLLPNRGYTEEEKRLVTSQRDPSLQWATGYTRGMRFSGFVFEDALVEKVVVPVLGFNPYDDYTDVAATIIRRTENAIAADRRQAEREAAGQTAPGPSPSG